jgi:hypothetical protein
MRGWGLFALGCALVLCGVLLAWRVQTAACS